MPQSQVCPHPCHTIPEKDICRHSEAEESSELHFCKDVNSKVGKGAENLWEARQKSQRCSQKKCRGSLQLLGRKKHLNSLLTGEEGVSQSSIPTHAWCWRAHSHSSARLALHPCEAVPLTSCPHLCDSWSARWDICPSRPPCIFIIGAYTSEMDAVGLRHCGLWGMPRGIHALTPPCRWGGAGYHQKLGLVTKPQWHWEVFQVRQDLGDSPKLSQMLDRTWAPVSPSGVVWSKLELCTVTH